MRKSSILPELNSWAPPRENRKMGLLPKLFVLVEAKMFQLTGLQYAIQVKFYLVPSTLALVEYQREVVPNSRRGLAIAVSHVADITMHGRLNTLAGRIIGEKAKAGG